MPSTIERYENMKENTNGKNAKGGKFRNEKILLYKEQKKNWQKF